MANLNTQNREWGSTGNEGTIKRKTLTGMFWSFFEIIMSKGIQSVVGIVLARLLSPADFGLVSMVVIFVVVSTSIIDSGLSQALIREKSPSEKDYATVFFFNLGISLLMFGLLFLSARWISIFFAEPRLINIIRVMSFILIIDAVSIIPRTILTRKVDFRTQTKIAGISSIISGVVAVIGALMGLGVWSLVINIMLMQLCQSLLLWVFNRWVPTRGVAIGSFKKMYSFGSKLLLSSLIDTIYSNVYYLIIGKFYSSVELGYFTNASKSRDIIMESITTAIERVAYPVLSWVQKQEQDLKDKYRKLIRLTNFFYFPVMLGLSIVAGPAFYVIFGSKWLAAASYFRLLCYSGAFYPLQALHMNILKVKGRSDITLKLEIYKKIIFTVCIVVSLQWGIIGILYGLLASTLLAWLLHGYYTYKLIMYTYKEQFADVIKSFSISLCMMIIVALSRSIVPNNYLLQLMLMLPTGFVSFLLISFLLRVEELEIVRDIKEAIISRKVSKG